MPVGCYKCHMKKLWRAIRHSISISWLVAAPMVIVIAIVGLGLVLWLTSQIAGILFGPEAADTFFYGFATVLGMLFWVAIIGGPICAVIAYVKSKRKQSQN